jgi:hypothetical protein
MTEQNRKWLAAVIVLTIVLFLLLLWIFAS